jgi:hypothetical protein
LRTWLTPLKKLNANYTADSPLVKHKSESKDICTVKKIPAAMTKTHCARIRKESAGLGMLKNYNNFLNLKEVNTISKRKKTQAKNSSLGLPSAS